MSKIGVFAIDPGGHTGMAWAIIDPKVQGGAAAALRQKEFAGSATIGGDERTQIAECVALWRDFYSACVREEDLLPESVYLVCEDFIYTGDNTYGGNSASISTALIWGIEGYRMGRADERRSLKRGIRIILPPMIMQTAGQAKGHATNERLRDWGLWVRGREHERSAWQHVAYFVSRYIQQHRS